jgi:hypothetical protein
MSSRNMASVAERGATHSGALKLPLVLTILFERPPWTIAANLDSNQLSFVASETNRLRKSLSMYGIF